MNRAIGQPKKLTIIVGRRVTRRHGGKLQTEIEDSNPGSPFHGRADKQRIKHNSS